MRVRDCMSAPPVTISPDRIYHEALRLIQEHQLHHLPVVDSQGMLVGIVAERDLLLAATRYIQNAVDVAEVMHSHVITANPDTPMTEAAALMIQYKIGSLPVADAERRLVGIITETDVFRAFVALLGEHTEPEANP